MNASSSTLSRADSALAWFARIAVGATFLLIFVGGLVTSWQAGMAVPDWPLSFGSINPAGWWQDWHVRLEHGHRLFAMLVALLTGILCAWTWGNWRALFVAALAAVLFPGAARVMDAPKELIVHLSIWPAAIVFAATLLWQARGGGPRYSAAVRWLAFAAFICVCVQATLGGLRVTQETAGAIDVARVLRIAHGCFAQAFLCIVVAVAVQLAPAWRERAWRYRGSALTAIRRLAWVTVAAIYLQLILGAAMRHLGAGLAIPTFPHATAEGGLLPAAHNASIDVNFTHTRAGAVLVTLLIAVLVTLVLRTAHREPRLTRPALALGALVAVQFALGIFVIWHLKPPTLTSFHVANGAALLAVSIVLALRAGRFTREPRAGAACLPEPKLTEVPA
ncbi:MAG: COX15/CtaA family protein [Verrucomicrobiota bacterium]|nr:COX15/CtaA family protein [Verrucomicrobiota bacterium]